MNKVFLGGLLIFSLLITGCVKKPILYTSDEIMEEFSPGYFDFKYLSARARIVIEESSGKTTRGTLNIRAKKDSIIWFSITPGLGIEAVRGMVTRDKIRIKDRMNGEDINMNFAEFEDRFGLKLSLEIFQNFVFANIPNEFSYRDRLLRIGRSFELTQVRDGVRYHSKVSTSHGKVEELTSNSLNGLGALLASYPTFETVKNQPFPNKMLFKLSFKIPEEIQNFIILVEMAKIETQTNSLTFPFQF